MDRQPAEHSEATTGADCRSGSRGLFCLSRWAVTFGLALVFGVVYPLVRAIPTPQCGVLHATNLRDSADGLEFCGPASASFVDLQQTRFPVRARWETDRPGRVGEEVAYALRLETRAGRPLAESDLAVVHTRRVHLLVVDPSLADYQHLHPDWDGRDAWRGSFTPRLPGRYRIYVEVVPIATAAPVLTYAELEVAEAGGSRWQPSAPPGSAGEAVPLGDFRASLSFLDGKPRAGLEAELLLELVPATGVPGPVPLELIMGAWAHLVAFDAGGRGVAHLHPMDESGPLPETNPAFAFTFRTDLPGRYRFWAQLILAGEERFVPFDVDVAPEFR